MSEAANPSCPPFAKGGIPFGQSLAYSPLCKGGKGDLYILKMELSEIKSSIKVKKIALFM
jgi:hypothetical protein